MKVRTHFHHKVIGFNGEINPENGQVKNGVQIIVIGYTTEQKALERVKQMVTRENYKLESVWECNEADTEELKQEYISLIKKMNKHMGDDYDL